ncbi:MAG: DUF711 family protein, partial [Lachnospiraceae bacterium]|nr:DUF711 family protein [Lachnospiraceae bacterium]
MINLHEVTETNEMIQRENLDVRTITMGISLMDCVSSDPDSLCDNIYAKITDNAGNSGYISTQGVWYDTNEPKAKSAKATPEDTKATVEIKGED